MVLSFFIAQAMQPPDPGLRLKYYWKLIQRFNVTNLVLKSLNSRRKASQIVLKCNCQTFKIWITCFLRKIPPLTLASNSNFLIIISLQRRGALNMFFSWVKMAWDCLSLSVFQNHWLTIVFIPLLFLFLELRILSFCLLLCRSCHRDRKPYSQFFSR